MCQLLLVIPIKTTKKQPKMSQKSPQVVKHVVKGEKWACSTPKTGKNKPILYIAKTRDFARNKRKIGNLTTPDFGLSDKT